MGIYPEEKWERKPQDDRDSDVQAIHTHHEPGLTIIETYLRVDVKVDRTDCFCCSCGEREGSDPACRNHGFAARRPCDIHNLPGQPWDNFELAGPGTIDRHSGEMPEPVSFARAQN